MANSRYFPNFAAKINNIFNKSSSFFKLMSLPKTITPCPIIDALVEIRFETDVNPNVVFGLIYSAIQQEYNGQIISLPILQLPEAVRNSDPALKFKPLYRIDCEGVSLHVGPDVLSVSSKIPYIGWDNFKKHIARIIELVRESHVIKRVLRFGHRYTNFFDADIAHCITMSFEMTEGYVPKNLQITTQVEGDGFMNTVQFSNTAVFNLHQRNQKNGSIIDIDTYKNYGDGSFFNNVDQELEGAHQSEKKLFFSLLKSGFIEKLNPEY